MELAARIPVRHKLAGGGKGILTHRASPGAQALARALQAAFTKVVKGPGEPRPDWLRYL